MASRKVSEKRQQLIKMSQKARAQMDAGITDAATVNEWIMSQYPDGEFHTFNDWKKQGFKILKGSTGYPIWSRKLKMTKKDESTGEDKEFKQFMVCNLFHESQVVKPQEDYSPRA